MIYNDDIVEEVRTRNDIVDVISGYVKLKKQGSNYFGLCPFHNEKSGSFSVSAQKQMYYCFGCGEGGNVFSFIMKYDNCSFPEALSTLAQRAGVSLPEREMSNEEKRARSIKSQIYEINKLAAKYYYALLRQDVGKIGLQYLTGRKLSKETMQQFGLGYAAKSGGLYQYLRKEGYSDELIRQSGLMNVDERRGMSDKFWNRVIFPIMDINNKVIGFGGRVMGDGKPKYLNSPETIIFDKGRNLYGLNIARHSRAGHIIVCEGYMDVISMHQAGFTQAVASLGTALTTAHAGLLKRYTQEILLLYDSDEAGVKAALRAIEKCREVDLTTRVVNLKPYKDPDEFIGALGAEEFQKRLDQAENSFYFELRMEENNFHMSDPDGRTRFLEEAAKRIAAFPSELERANYIQAVAARYSIAPKLMEGEVAKAAARMEGISQITRPKPTTGNREKEDGFMLAQKLLITWLTDEPKVFAQVKEYVNPEDFTEGICRKVATVLYRQLEEEKLNPAAIVSLFEDEEEHRQVAALFNTKLTEIEALPEKEKAITDLVIKIRQYSLQNSSPADLGADPIKAAVAKKKQLEELRKIHITLS